jgi:aspartate 1-decarboxylase
MKCRTLFKGDVIIVIWFQELLAQEGQVSSTKVYVTNNKNYLRILNSL